MFTEKPKRKRKQHKHSFIRSLLVILIGLPITFFAINAGLGKSLLADGIALSVMICAAVYILQQGILWLIAAYLNIPNENSTNSHYTDEME